MEGVKLLSHEDCEDLLEGSLWLSTGGSGRLEKGLAIGFHDLDYFALKIKPASPRIRSS
jgi:hypothetical protein